MSMTTNKRRSRRTHSLEVTTMLLYPYDVEAFCHDRDIDVRNREDANAPKARWTWIAGRRYRGLKRY